MSPADDLMVEGRPIALDKDGYLRNLADWSPAVADALAVREGITLGDEQRAVIEVIRNFHARYGISPATRVLVKAVARELGTEAGTSAWLMMRFPSTQSPALVVARIAGLPRPTHCF